MRFPTPSALAACFLATAAANPVDVPFATDFSTEFGGFYAPTGNGYNWGHNWRAENYQSWISAGNRTVTASQQARELAGRDFSIRVNVDPVELVGSGHSVGVAACGSSRTFGSYYLADVKPALNTARLVRISGGNTFLVAEQEISDIDLSDLAPFELRLDGDFTGNSLRLQFAVIKGGRTATFTASDSAALTGDYYGLRARTGGAGRFENHFDDYQLDHLNPGAPTPVPPQFAPVGIEYEHVGNGNQPDGIPAWADILPSGGFFGTPTDGDIGTFTVRYPGAIEPHIDPVEVVVTVPAPADVVISEFMADNDDTLADEDGDASDWIELFNPTADPVDLSGWHLTDDPAAPRKWPLPDGTVLAPFEFRVFFASGKALPGHANFALERNHGHLALHRPDGSAASEFTDYPSQQEDISYGVYDDYATAGYLLEPTPGAANASTGYAGFVADTKFDIGRGFYDAPFTVAVSCSTPGATIVTTTDGTEPTPTNGTPSASPASVPISATTVLRAAAFAPGLAPSDVDTQTYLFLDDVRTQDSSGAQASGWPGSSINGQVFNYGMDPDIVGRYTAAEFEAAMTGIATISMVTDLDNFNDPDTGFWVNAENRGRAWERPVSIELLDPSGGDSFQIDAGVRLRGGFSRQGSNPKHSFHLYFRSDYGTGKLDYPLFGDEGTNTFDALDLRATQGRSWHFSNSTDATFNRDVFGRDTQRDMGQPYSRSRYYHLYINGQYFGLFQSQERVDKFYAASYFGGDKAEYDVIKTRTKPHRVEALDGSPDAWSRLFDAAVAGFAEDPAYFAVQGLDATGIPDPGGENLLDVDNLIDYMLVIFYTGQRDGPVNLGANVPKNFFALRPRDGHFGFRFFVHDNEDSFQSVGADSTVDNNTGDRLIYFNPKWLHQRLAANPRYRQRFADRAHRHLFNGGALTTPAAQARFQNTADILTNAIIGESARWGDFKRGDPYDREDWQSAVNGKINSWIPQRHGILLAQLRSRGLYPDVAAPTLSQHGGRVAPGTPLSIEAPAGQVYYTLDGSDPSEPGALLFGGGAEEFTLVARETAPWYHWQPRTDPGSSSTIVIGHPSYNELDWKHPLFDDTAWDAGPGALGYGNVGHFYQTDLVIYPTPRPITSYFRRPFSIAGAAGFTSLQLNVRRDDGAILYLNGREVVRTNMPAGPVDFSTPTPGTDTPNESNYLPFTHIPSPGDLVEGENLLAVEVHQNSASSGDMVIDVELVGTAPSGGLLINGNTTVKARALVDGEWSALTEATFYTSVPADASNLVVSEIYYNPPGASEEGEFLELRNISTTDTVHLDGLAFVSGITFEFPPGLTLAPGGRLVLARSAAAHPGALIYTGSLDNGGERLALSGVFDFSYDDSHPWPELADGDGRSLVFLGGELGLAKNWRPSAVDGGSPGGVDSTTFPGGDLDTYAFGAFVPSFRADGAFAFARNLAADDLAYTIEVSEDLETWSSASNWNLEPLAPLDGAFATQHASPPDGSPPAMMGFVRARARLR